LAFNINNFKAVIDKHGGPARTSLFEVLISPQSVSGRTIVPNVITTDDLRFFCQTVSVPGINLETASYRPTGIGFPESMPMNTQPDTLNCVFMLDSNHRVLTFFHRWISSVINVNADRGDNPNGLPMHQIEYKENYAATAMTIKHYSTHNLKNIRDIPDSSYDYIYYGIYPTQVSTINLSWADKNTPATVTVNFAYSKMSYSGFRSNSAETSTNFIDERYSAVRGGTIPGVLIDTAASNLPS
jgi:hypothetical protein